MILWTLRGRLALACLVVVGCSHADERETSPSAGPVESERPALVVMVVVDQLSQELLDRYDDVFTGGFRRLIDGGRWYVNATHDHAGTVTAAGHATLSTGTYPSHHGIVANEWFEKWTVNGSRSRRSETPRSRSPAFRSRRASPAHPERSGLADWIVAGRRRAPRWRPCHPRTGARSCPPAHMRVRFGGSSTSVGRFVTSTYYRDSYPEWIDRFHDDVLTPARGRHLWTSGCRRLERRPQRSGHAPPTRATSRPRTSRTGSAVPTSVHDFWEWFERTPMLDEATLELARDRGHGNGAGQDPGARLPGVSLSQTDSVGHDFGPLSREQLDNLLRLDASWASSSLSSTPSRGPGAGSRPVRRPWRPGNRARLRIGESASARRWTAEEEAALAEIQAEAEEAEGVTPTEVAAALEELDLRSRGLDPRGADDAGSPADSFAELERHSLYPGRAREEIQPVGRRGAVRSVLPGPRAGLRATEPRTGTISNVPLLFYGPGVTAGRDSTRASTVDFAPTLARLLGIPFPQDLDGAPLGGVVGD